MPNPTPFPDEPVHLDAEATRLVVLTPEDEDRFVRDCRWVIEVSKLGISRDVWLRELHALLSHVRRWAEQRADQVRASFAMQRDDQVAVFVVPAKGSYEFGLEDALTRLDVELAERFQAVQCDVLQMPDKPLEEIEDLAGRSLAILIYGQSSAAPSTVAPQP